MYCRLLSKPGGYQWIFPSAFRKTKEVRPTFLVKQKQKKPSKKYQGSTSSCDSQNRQSSGCAQVQVCLSPCSTWIKKKKKKTSVCGQNACSVQSVLRAAWRTRRNEGGERVRRDWMDSSGSSSHTAQDRDCSFISVSFQLAVQQFAHWISRQVKEASACQSTEAGQRAQRFTTLCQSMNQTQHTWKWIQPFPG